MNRAENQFTVPTAAIVSFVIGGVSLCLFLIQGFRLLAHPTVDLSGLSGTNLRAGASIVRNRSWKVSGRAVGRRNGCRVMLRILRAR
ncbi:MAG: hypothetical protein J6M66_12425 [Lachnospiraceae bacterium]|nr:hypothetical protein [Lachnospiraceae bacterium]